MIEITERQLDTITDLAYRKYGLYIGTDKVSRLLPKLERFMTLEDYSSTDELCKRLASNDRACLEKFISTSRRAIRSFSVNRIISANLWPICAAFRGQYIRYGVQPVLPGKNRIRSR